MAGATSDGRDGGPDGLGRFAVYRFRTTLRSRLGGFLAVVLLGGLLGGVAMATVAGARATQSAYPDYLALSNTSELTFTYSTAGTFVNPYNPAFTRRIDHVRGVRSVGVEPFLALNLITRSGSPITVAGFDDSEVDTDGSFNGMFVSQDRPVADQGRVFDPTRVDEFETTSEAAQINHWRVGQNFRFGAYSFPQLVNADYSFKNVKPVYVFTARMVGIVGDAETVANDQIDELPGAVIFTPALTRALPLSTVAYPQYDLTVPGGSTGVGRVERELVSMLPRAATYTFNVTSAHEGAVERAVEPESIALGAFGIITGLAMLVIVTQAITRGVRRNAREFDVLRALGATPRMLVLDGVGGYLGALALAGLLAAVTSLALSPLFPIGAVRQIDPAPGLHTDALVLAVGLGLLVVVLAVLALGFTALLVRRRAARPSDDEPVRPSRVAQAATQMGLPASGVMGIRFAFERGGSRNSVPVGSTLIGCVLAVSVVTATLTFGSGLSTLVTHPSLYGWNWDYSIQQVGGGNVPPVTQAMIGRDPDVASWADYQTADVQIDGQAVPMLLARPGAAIGPPILSGRGLEGNHQIVLGGATLKQLHKTVGDFVTATYGSPADEPLYVPPTRLRIVGTTTLPAVGNPEGGLHPSMGAGGLMSIDLPSPAFRRALNSPDPNLNGPPLVFVRLRSTVSRSAGLASLEQVVHRSDRVLDADPQAGGGLFEVVKVEQPAEIVNYKMMGSTPAYLALGLAAGAVVALALTLVASIRRRRRELALLRTLGYVQRQLAAVVSWQASAVAVVGIAVGIPVGIVAGRQLWAAFADAIYAVAAPTVPTVQLVLVGLGALVLANVVAVLPGRIAARTPTAVLLRSE